MPSRATRSTQEAARRRQDDEALATAILQKEKNAANNDGLKAAKVTVAVDTYPIQVPLPLVVSPPSAPNLTSLLTGHVGQEVGNKASSDMDINTQDVEQVEDSAKSHKKKKTKKVKSTKEDTSTKRNRSSLSLKKTSSATQSVAATSSTKDYKFERVFYEAGLNSRARINTVPMLSTSEIYLKTFSWSTRLQLCMRSTSRGAQSLLAPSRK